MVAKFERGIEWT